MQDQEVKIPVRILKTERKPEKRRGFSAFFKSPQLKILACILVIVLNWAGFSAVLGTAASFSDTETSFGNLFEAGTLDFELDSPSDFLPACLTSESDPAERTISIKNNGNPFKYMVSSAGFSSELCDYLILEANIGGGDPEYLGKLKDFNAGIFEFSDPEDWVFKLTIPPDLPAELQGKTCNFKFVFDGSQTKNDLPFGEGFTDIEEISSSITAAMCRDAETRTIGYWKTHPEVYNPSLLPISLGDDEIDNQSDVEEVFADYDLSMRNKLRGQLLAMKFNIKAFDIGEYIPEGDTRTLDEIVEEADKLLEQDPSPANSELEKMKDLLDTLNNLHEISICPTTCTQSSIKEITEQENAINDLFSGENSLPGNNNSDKNKNGNSPGSVKKNIIEEEIGITTDTPELVYNASRSARKKVNIIVPGQNILKKKWVKVRVNGKNIPILKMRKHGNDTILQLNLKYKKWAVGKYDLTLSYKNREKQSVTGKNGKMLQKNIWSWKSTIAKELFSII